MLAMFITSSVRWSMIGVNVLYSPTVGLFSGLFYIIRPEMLTWYRAKWMSPS